MCRTNLDMQILKVGALKQNDEKSVLWQKICWSAQEH